MLSNAALAGALASAYLTVLWLHLNPSLPLSAATLAPLALVMALAYGLNLAVAGYMLIVLRQVTASEVLSPGWFSVRLLSWLCMLAAAGVVVVWWLNVRGYSTVLAPAVQTRLIAGAIALSASAVVFLLIALAHVGRRGGAPSAALLVAMIAISIAAPLAARGGGGPAPAAVPLAAPIEPEDVEVGARVVLLAFDGASLDMISPAVAEGHLPNLGRMLDGGAMLHLATLKPTQAEPVWSAALTGKPPSSNGIRASSRYRVLGGPALELLPDYCFAQALVRFGFLHEEPHQASSLIAKPLWGILGESGVSVGIIGFPVSHPAPAVRGYLVSDEFHRLGAAERALDAGGAVFPPTLLTEARVALAEPPPAADALLASIAEASPGADARPDPAPIAGDRMHLQLMRALERREQVRFLAVRFPGIDAVGHYFLRFANPSAFGDVSDEERRAYGRVLADYYGRIDAIVGEALAALAPGDLLLVVSGFGMEPLTPGKRVLEQLVGNPRVSGSHERAPDGFLLAYGGAVAAGRRDRASLVDLTPTVLYYFGIPAGRDMAGYARTDLFQPAFTASHPVTFIPTWGR